MHGRNGKPEFAVGVGAVGGAQHGVALRDRVDGLVQPRDVDVPGDPVGQAHVEQRTAGIGRMHEPQPQLALGQRFAVARAVPGGGGQPTLVQPAAQQFQPPLVQLGSGVDVSHARNPLSM